MIRLCIARDVDVAGIVYEEAVLNPNVIVLIDGDAGDLAQHPIVGKRFGLGRINLE